MKTLNQAQVDAIAARIRELLEDGPRRFAIEPGRGATYSNGRATLYAYSRYGRSSVLSGRQRREWIEDADEDEGGAELLKAACKAAGVECDCSAVSGFTPDSLADLPGEEGDEA